MKQGRIPRNLTLLATSIVFFTNALAGTITLQWDPVESAEGYRIYYALESGAYNDTDYMEIGNVTEATLTGLQDCTEYFRAVKGFNSAGESEEFSNEISGWARPVVTTDTVTSATQGDQITLELDGVNFMPGADLLVPDNPGLIVDSVSVSNCNRLLAALTLEPMAQDVRPATVGTYSVQVVNPDDVFNQSSNVIEVRINKARFDINKVEESSRDRVDGQDTLWLLRQFGVEENDPLYDPDYDMDGNGWVDGDDLAYLASGFGRCWDGQNWNVNACPEGTR